MVFPSTFFSLHWQAAAFLSLVAFVLSNPNPYVLSTAQHIFSKLQFFLVASGPHLLAVLCIAVGHRKLEEPRASGVGNAGVLVSFVLCVTSKNPYGSFLARLFLTEGSFPQFF